MNGRLRNLIILMILILIVLTAVYLATTGVIYKAFGVIEQRDVAQNTSRAVDALKGRVDQLQFKVSDWSSWDDSYAFVENHNKAFIKSNIQLNTLVNLGIDYMLFFNEHQQLVYSKGVDLDTSAEIAVPPQLITNFSPGSPLLSRDESSIANGIINTSESSILIVAKPILTSDGTGPIHGTLVFAKTLSPVVVDQLAAVTHLSLGYWRTNDKTSPIDVMAANRSLTTQSASITPLSESRIAGYQQISDAYGQPGLVAKVELPRTIHLEAKHTLSQYLLIIALATLVAFLIAVVLSVVIRNRDRTIELKDEFFSMASHELRTPLTVIRDYAELLSLKFGKRLADPQFDNMVHTISESSKSLSGVVNDFLDAARLERGQIPFRIEPFDIREVISPLATEFTHLAAQKGVAVDVDYPTDLPMVLGDRERVRQVVTNLIGNSLKFTDEGAVTIRPLVEGNTMTIYVADTGRGMTKPQQQLMFKKFRQVHTEDSLKGSGLGLFISKMLVEQMGGHIQLESSAVGVGTTISFKLHAIAKRPTTKSAVSTPAVAAPKTV